MTVSQADSAVAMPAEIRSVLERSLPMAVTTIDPDGMPQLSLVWQEPQEDTIVFFSDASSRKVRNLRRDSRLACLVVDDQHSLGDGVPCFVWARGRAQLEARDDALVERLTARYMGLAHYPFGDLDPFVVVRLVPSHFGGNVPGASTPATRS